MLLNVYKISKETGLMEHSGAYDDLSIEMADFEVRQVTKFDRMWSIGPGGSIAQIPLIVDGLVYFAS